MGGFFIDDVIRTIARNVRREVRRRKAAKWTVAVGKVSRFRTTDGDWHGLRPIVDYEYEVNGRIEYGSATGFSTNKDINPIGDAVDALGELRIRFDPADPSINRALSEDNPKIPFEIDHDVS
jgi:hypothetical protein